MKNKLKKNAVILEIVNEKKIIVKLEESQAEVPARLSSKVMQGRKPLIVGDQVVVLSNPYDKSRVAIHSDTWEKR